MIASRAGGVVVGPLRALWGIGVVGRLSDHQLLEGFATGDGETAELSFQGARRTAWANGVAGLSAAARRPKRRRGRVPGNLYGLAAQSGRIRDRGSVASWLHGAAARIAARARVEAARRRRIERQGARPVVQRKDGFEHLDLESLIQEELARLPEIYRHVIVLCYLEGLTHEGAAGQLGWPIGTVRGRLARARELLRARLVRRGVTATASVAAIESLTRSASAAVPAALREATVRAAMRIASGQAVAAITSTQVAAWAEGACRVMTLYRWKAAAGLIVLIGTLRFVIGLALAGSESPQPPPEVNHTPALVARQDRTANLREMLLLKGTWASQEIMKESIDHVPQPPKTVKIIWSIDRDTITESDENGFAWHTYHFALDPDRTPKTIDLTMLNTGLELRGIYRLEGESLTIHYGLDRPKEFEKKATQSQRTFRRESRAPRNSLRSSPPLPVATGPSSRETDWRAR